MAMKPKKIMNVNRPESLGGGRGTGEGLTGSKKANPKSAPNKAPVKKKDYSANEKALNDAVSRILNGPWRNDL